MKKLILKKSKKEVKFGDTLTRKSTFKTLTGKGTIVEKILLTEETLPDFIKEGVLEVIDIPNQQEYKKEFKPSEELSFYVGKIAKKIGVEYEQAMDILDTINTINPSALFSILIKEIAIELDKKYPDHIRNSKELYCISMADGAIFKLNKNSIKNFNNFSAFRNVKDAEFAVSILSNLWCNLFLNKDGKE